MPIENCKNEQKTVINQLYCCGRVIRAMAYNLEAVCSKPQFRIIQMFLANFFTLICKYYVSVENVEILVTFLGITVGHEASFPKSAVKEKLNPILNHLSYFFLEFIKIRVYF